MPNQVKGNPMRPFTVNFYLGDRIVPFEDFMPEEGYLIIGEENIGTFTENYGGYQIKEVYNSHHRSCDDRKTICLYQFRKE